MSTIIDRIRFGRSNITYKIKRTARRKTLAVSVSADAGVTVLAPPRLRRKLIAEIVNMQAAWIVEKQDQAARFGVRKKRRFVSGESIPYLGRHYQLKVVSKRGRFVEASVLVNRGQFRVTVGQGWSREQKREAVRMALRGWFRMHSLERFTKIADQFSQQLGIAYKNLRVFEMKSRWGSSGTNANLRLNWRTIMAPRRLVEYVVAHELCHLKHNDHSSAFWLLLKSVMPDYVLRREQLAILGVTLDL